METMCTYDETLIYSSLLSEVAYFLILEDFTSSTYPYLQEVCTVHTAIQRPLNCYLVNRFQNSDETGDRLPHETDSPLTDMDLFVGDHLDVRARQPFSMHQILSGLLSCWVPPRISAAEEPRQLFGLHPSKKICSAKVEWFHEIHCWTTMPKSIQVSRRYCYSCKTSYKSSQLICQCLMPPR